MTFIYLLYLVLIILGSSHRYHPILIPKEDNCYLSTVHIAVPILGSSHRCLSSYLDTKRRRLLLDPEDGVTSKDEYPWIWLR